MASVESLQQVLRELVAERQILREHNAGRVALESNRLEVARRQRELSHALIDRYCAEASAHRRLQLRRSSVRGDGTARQGRATAIARVSERGAQSRAH